MAKFRYYITDLMDGNVKGTDDRVVALEHSELEEYFVVDAEEGEWLSIGETVDIKDVDES